MYNIDLDDSLCTHSLFCENTLLSKKKIKTPNLRTLQARDKLVCSGQNTAHL